jgi:hypothetical protein
MELATTLLLQSPRFVGSLNSEGQYEDAALHVLTTPDCKYICSIDREPRFIFCAAAACTSKLVDSLSIPFVFKVQQQMVSMLTFVAISCKFAHIRLSNTFIRH